MTKLVIKWALLAPVSLFMAVFARLLCPVLPLFADDEGYLPEWLWWFQTPFDTLDGDSGSWERHPGTGKWQTYWRRVCWLWRNAAYGFDMRVCGIKVNPDSDQIPTLAIPTLATTLALAESADGTHTAAASLSHGSGTTASTTTFSGFINACVLASAGKSGAKRNSMTNPLSTGSISILLSN